MAKPPRVYPSIESTFDMHRADLRDYSWRLHRDLNDEGEKRIKLLSQHAEALKCEIGTFIEESTAKSIAKINAALGKCGRCPHWNQQASVEPAGQAEGGSDA